MYQHIKPKQFAYPLTSLVNQNVFSNRPLLITVLKEQQIEPIDFIHQTLKIFLSFHLQALKNHLNISVAASNMIFCFDSNKIDKIIYRAPRITSIIQNPFYFTTQTKELAQSIITCLRNHYPKFNQVCIEQLIKIVISEIESAQLDILNKKTKPKLVLV